MRVSADAAARFITLYVRLLYYAGQQRDVLPPDMSYYEFLEFLPKPRLPISVKTVLLPYNGVVVCDGMLSVYDIVFGPNMRSGFNEVYKNMKSAERFFTVL